MNPSRNTVDRSLDTLDPGSSEDSSERRRNSLNKNIIIDRNEGYMDRVADSNKRGPSISMSDSGVQLVSLFSSTSNSISKIDTNAKENQIESTSSIVSISNNSNNKGGGGGVGMVGCINNQESISSVNNSHDNSSNSILTVDSQEAAPSSSASASGSSSSSSQYVSSSRKWMGSDAITVGHQNQYTQQSKSPPGVKDVSCHLYHFILAYIISYHIILSSTKSYSLIFLHSITPYIQSYHTILYYLIFHHTISPYFILS